jgi:hypothetical protein
MLLASSGALAAQEQDYVNAEKVLLGALRDAETPGRPENSDLANVLHQLGSLYHVSAKPAAAERFYQRALSGARRCREVPSRAWLKS